MALTLALFARNRTRLLHPIVPPKPAQSLHALRVSFNITLFITGAFALAAGGSADYIALCSLTAVWSVGVGGNLPVDSAIFLGECAFSCAHARRESWGTQARVHDKLRYSGELPRWYHQCESIQTNRT